MTYAFLQEQVLRARAVADAVVSQLQVRAKRLFMVLGRAASCPGPALGNVSSVLDPTFRVPSEAVLATICLAIQCGRAFHQGISLRFVAWLSPRHS